MSSLLTATSNNRPLNPNIGDMYFETDTGRIIVYAGAGWSRYTPTAAESVDNSGEIDIFYGTFDEILAVQDKSPGDLFFKKTQDYITKIEFEHPPGSSQGTANNGTSIYVIRMDEDDIIISQTISPRLSANASGQPYYFDMDQANWGTPDWQGSQNFVDVLDALSALPAGATAVVSGDNNQVITFTSPTWMHISANYYFLKFPPKPDYYNTENALLVYTGLDNNDNELYSMITNY